MFGNSERALLELPLLTKGVRFSEISKKYFEKPEQNTSSLRYIDEVSME
jgi:hypothetical protein